MAARATVAALLMLAAGSPMAAAQAPLSGPGPKIVAPLPADWAALAKLPDWSGVWFPDIRDQTAKIITDRPPWNAKAAAQVAKATREEIDGHPRLPFTNCLPMGMPSWVLINHNPMEILFTPGRVTMLGDSDGGRLRRIYTDGRGHPEDPDLTFHGHSVGHWEKDTLVVDTVGVLPEAWLAVSEAVAVPVNGDVHIVERIHLAGQDLLKDEMVVTAPAILTAPWKTERISHRERDRKFEIVEGSCLQGSFAEGRDEDGFAIFTPIEVKNGNATSRND